MARIPYADMSNPAVAPLVKQIERERTRVGPLYQLLLNSPPVCQGWLDFLTAIRQKATLPGRYREMAIIRIAIVNGADHEKKSHIPHALQAGMTQGQIDALANWESAACFDERDRTVLAYTDAMTRNIRVEKPVFDAVRSAFNDREITELTATIAAYNMVSRFLEALEVGH